jgi:hypothetical protein
MTKNKNQPVAEPSSAPATTADPFAAFETARVVTMPLLKMGEGDRVAVGIVSNIYAGREIKSSRSGEQREKPADLMRVVNLITGELQTMIAAALIKSELTENYPNDGYAGKCFVIERGAKKTGGSRSYNTYNIREIKCPANIKLPPVETVADQSKPKAE